jgi:hypothetical protein
VEYDSDVHDPSVTNQISYLLEGDRNWGHKDTGDPSETLYWESYRYKTSWQQSDTKKFTYMYGTNYGDSRKTIYPDGSTWYKFRWGLKSPDDGDLGSSSTGKATGAYQFINDKVTTVEKFFFGGGFTTSTSLDVINKIINLDSFIEYWLVYEMTLNQEPNNPGSCYMHYYNGDGKLYMGPVWDFDYGSFLTSAQFDDGLYQNKDTHFLIANSLWYCRLLKNTNVQEYIKQKWPTYKAAAQSVADEKIKKSDDDAVIALKRTKDILKALGERKKAGQFLCGFSMETENVIENSRAKLKKKNADMICANSLREDGAGFGVDTNVLTLIEKGGAVTQLPLDTKENLAVAILDKIATMN